MRAVLCGLVLCALSPRIGGFDLLPDWLGAMLLYRGSKELSVNSDYFRRCQPFALALCLLGIPLWLVHKMPQFPFTPYLAVSGGFLMLYTIFLLVRGIRDLEALFTCPLGFVQLRMSFWFLVAMQLLYYAFSSTFPWLRTTVLVASLALIFFWWRSCRLTQPLL